MKKSFIVVMSLAIQFACNSPQDKEIKPAGEKLFTAMSPEQTHVDFINKVSDQETFNILTYRNFYNGGGVALGDINNDGLSDIFLTSNMEKNKLYLNKGNFVFEDISAKAGIEGTRSWSTGVTMADVNA